MDEIVFHLKRGLPRWERIGHPLDTLSVLLCFACVLFLPYSTEMLYWYIGLAVFSCLLVTKDEFVHKHHCPASEQWLHALLFINHPIMLASLGLSWPLLKNDTLFSWLAPWKEHREALIFFLAIQALFIFCFFLYQIIYWNFIWKER
jgi:hypothetical protein